MAFKNNILSFQGNQPTEPRFVLREEYRNTVNACRQALLKTVPRLMESMFEQLDDALYALADKAESDRQQTAFFDAMREMRRQREAIENGFNRRILLDYDRFWQSGPEPAGPGRAEGRDSDEFSLVENADLEEGLAVNNMISRGENRHYRELYALNQRFSHLVDGTVGSASNPLAPAVLGHAFHVTIKSLSLDVPVKLVIYKQFEHAVIDSLGQLYGEINGILARAGILPKLSHRIKRRPHYAPAAAVSGSHDVGDASVQDAGDPAFQAELFSMLQQMLGQRRTRQPLEQAQGPLIESADVVDALSSLQQANMAAITSAALSDLSALDLRATLRQAIQARTEVDEHRIQESDEDAIDVISMLFEFILEDRNLPDAMKALLARLQIPMLKVAIIDREFFSRKNHPARRLLNNMAQAAIGWSEAAGRADGGLHAKMESIVERVLGRFEDDVDLFAELNEEFTEFLAHEEQVTELAEKRVTQVTQGKEQLRAARQRVAQEIERRRAGQDAIPAVVEDLLQDGWKDVLLLILLRKGEQSGEWQEALTLVERLLWSVQPKPHADQRQQLLQEIPGLLKALRKGLSEISYDQHRMASLFKDLQACHVICLQGSEPEAGHPAPDPAPPQPVEVAASPAGTPAPAVDQGGGETAPGQDQEPEAAEQGLEASEQDPFLERAATLPLGTWLEVTEPSGERFRAKLSWRSKVTGTCLFVNRKGMKVAELSLEALAGWFRDDRAVELREVNVPLMDRALVAMMKVLKDTDTEGVRRPA